MNTISLHLEHVSPDFRKRLEAFIAREQGRSHSFKSKTTILVGLLAKGLEAEEKAAKL